LNPAPATPTGANAGSTRAVAATTSTSSAGPIGVIVRNPLGRLGR
jgi:hypothetical protein